MTHPPENVLFEYIFDTLETKEKDDVRVHLKYCRQCRARHKVCQQEAAVLNRDDLTPMTPEQVAEVRAQRKA